LDYNRIRLYQRTKNSLGAIQNTYFRSMRNNHFNHGDPRVFISYDSNLCNTLIGNVYNHKKAIETRKFKMVKQNDSNKLKENHKRVEGYGSLLNCKERQKILCIGGMMKAIREIKRTRWKLSFDRRSIKRCEAVLNLVETGNHADIYWTKVYEVDDEAFNAIMDREMGRETARKWLCGKRIKPDSYRPIKMDSELGETYLFIILEEGRKLTPTSESSKYVQIVREGICESFSGEERDINLKALEKAVIESKKQRLRS